MLFNKKYRREKFAVGVRFPQISKFGNSSVIVAKRCCAKRTKC